MPADIFEDMLSLRTANGLLGRSAILEAAAALRMAEAGTTSPARLITLLCDESLTAEELATKIYSHFQIKLSTDYKDFKKDIALLQSFYLLLKVSFA